MVCLHSPSSICIVICVWLQCFIAAKGKVETIRKKHKEKNIFEERYYLTYTTDVAVNFQYIQS